MRKHRIRPKRNFMRGIIMKKLLKISAVVVVVLAVATVGLVTARAAGWPEPIRRARGFAAGPVVGRAVPGFLAPAAYYAYPQTAYVAPFCAPAPVVVQAPPVYCLSAPVLYPMICAPVRLPLIAARPHYVRR
jgi:hypothetical protein